MRTSIPLKGRRIKNRVSLAYFDNGSYQCHTNRCAATAKAIQYHQQPTLAEFPALPEPTHASSKIVLESDASSRHDSRHSGHSNITQTHSFDPESLLPSPTADEPEREDPGLIRSTTNDTVRTQRHVRPSPGGSIHRKTLVPIQLGPVILRDASEITHDNTAAMPSGSGDSRSKHRHERSESTQNLLSNASRPSYFDNREMPHQRYGRHSAETLTLHLHSQETVAPRATKSTHSLSSSFTQHSRDISTSSSLLTLTERPKTGARLQRKRSNQSKSSFGNPGDSDVEKEVLELNTIVEERRAEGNRVRSRDSRHIPAVAPSMQVGVRSETLNDIGSALSRPLAVQHPTTGEVSAGLEGKEHQPRSSRVSGWLSDVTTSAKSDADNNEPFYKYYADTTHERNVSMNSSATAVDSGPHTLDSSPTTSKRYSRSLMITPLTPVDDGVDHDGGRRVGIAL